MSRGNLVAPTAVLGLALGLLTGCSGPSSERNLSVAATPTPIAETAANKCTPALLAPGFTRDANYSGDLTPSQYSASADVQAALLYDQYQSGYRTVLTALAPGKPTPAEVFASCVSMRFADDEDAKRFLGSYRDLRGQAGNLVQTVDAGKVGTLTDLVAYNEKGQSFHGYGVDNADVFEIAGRLGPRLFIATAGGSAPTVDQARTLANAMVDG